jgi:peptide/nickel transport system substrate-binding protein
MPTRREFFGVDGKGAAFVSAGALLAACGSSASSSTDATPAGSAGRPRAGGTLTAGLVGGSAKDTLDPHISFDTIDTVRALALFSPLVRQQVVGQDNEYILAEELTPSADLRSWTIRLKPDLEFSNGKPITAEDVLFTFRRITDPKDPLNGAAPLSLLNTNDATILDSRTVRIGTNAPFGSFPEQISSGFNFQIVPVDFDPKNPVSSGAFKVKSFTPGQQSVFVRNEHYYKSGQPYLDQLTIVDLSDDQAGYNAVLTGQIDAYGAALFSLANEARSQSNLQVLISYASQWIPFTLRVDKAPFTDVRVRQAFRLLANRPQLLQDAFSGYGVVGNDLYGWSDPDFPSDWKREQDIPQAKSLLKAAGYDDAPVTLVTADFAPGAVALTQAFAQQASAAGVKINVDQVTTNTYENGYGNWTFSQDWWNNHPYLATAGLAFLPTGVWNETHFNDPQYTALYKEANATVDPARLREVKHAMWTIDFNQGSWIIPVDNQIIDVLGKHVQGFPRAATGTAFGDARFDQVWLSS